ncbi:twin-arginine translocation signal domain-containing protein [Alcanivorax sp.]|uniref:twin-arginine translocation signal domain-containing protein n=1 Tax=Alcanivorax sp. TaxID=1872427 RepID=UPI000C1021A2|nr:twin-arginine translocation signal domain-containing protein [Alcanivorax sp.]PHR64818.1 MAG: Tat pathway signal protein [Alcanivorax sp.]
MDQGINRRGFLKLSAAGSAVLATGSGLALLTGCSSNDGPAPGYKHFRQQDVDLLTPLVGAVLGSALTDVGATAEDGMKAFDDLLDGGMPGTRGALFQVLDLMQLGAARWYITGTWASFADQSEAELTQTLTEWAASERGLSRMAFKGLTQPIYMAWYVKPEAAHSTGYPGPPRKIVA